MLIVEHDDAIRELLRLHLLNAGYRVLLSADAIVAGRTILSLAGDLHVIVVAAELPYLSGTELVATLIADTTLPYVPVIMIAREPSHAQGIDRLGVPCLEVPFSAEKLLRVVGEVTERTVPIREKGSRPAMQELLDRSERRSKPRGGRPLRLVVADDEPDTVASLMAILSDEGHSVLGSHRGGEVLPRVRTEKPDAVILDIDMPGVSGYAVAREIREMFKATSCPMLIAISGKWMSDTDRVIAENSGFHHFLQKPCDPNRLLALLEPLRRSGA